MPQEKPKYTILVAVCKQQTKTHPTYYGIDLAGPVASDIMEYIYANDPSLHATIETPPSPYAPTNIKGGNTHYVAKVSHTLASQTKNESEGKTWSTTTTDVGGHTTLTGIATEKGVVPDVRGMGLSDALYLLESMGLTVTHSGSGRIRTQSLLAGHRMDAEGRGTIHLTLER